MFFVLKFGFSSSRSFARVSIVVIVFMSSFICVFNLSRGCKILMRSLKNKCGINIREKINCAKVSVGFIVMEMLKVLAESCTFTVSTKISKAFS